MLKLGFIGSNQIVNHRPPPNTVFQNNLQTQSRFSGSSPVRSHKRPGRLSTTKISMLIFNSVLTIK